MGTLPLFVVHGGLVWKLALGVAIGAVLALIVWNRRRDARSAARAELRVLDARTEAGVIRGTLGGGEASTVVARRWVDADIIADLRDEALWIETGEGRVMLDGPLRVVAGGRAFAARRGVPAETADALVAADPALHRPRFLKASISNARLSIVRAGDDVIALGQLETVAGTDEADNRTNASMRVLKPLGDAPITIAARAARGAAIPLPVVGAVLIAGIVGVVGWRIEVALGESWEKTCWQARSHFRDDNWTPADAPVDLSATNACVLAAATSSRNAALHDLSDIVAYNPYRDRATLDRIIALGELGGDCRELVKTLEGESRYDDMLVHARRCGDHSAELLALVYLGRFDEAAAVTTTEAERERDRLPIAQVLVLAGKWTEAAAMADRESVAAGEREHTPSQADAVAMTVLAYKCLGELLRFDGGDKAALDHLRALAAGPYGQTCLAALAEAVPEPERATVLAPQTGGLLETDVVKGELRAFAGLAPGFEITGPEKTLATLDELDASSVGLALWLSEIAPPLGDDSAPSTRLHRERWLTVASVLAGDLAAGRDHAARALAIQLPDDDFEVSLSRIDLPMLPELVAFYAGEPVDVKIPVDELPRELWLHTYGSLLLRHGDPIPKDTYFGSRNAYPKALEAAAAGDGRALAVEMSNNDMSWWRDVDIIAVLPRIKLGREAVARQLAWSAPHDHERLEFKMPWSMAMYAAGRRSALQLAGDTARAAWWNEIYKRYDQALRDRRKAVALALWKL
jgi:hypothetical protein